MAYGNSYPKFMSRSESRKLHAVDDPDKPHLRTPVAFIPSLHLREVKSQARPFYVASGVLHNTYVSLYESKAEDGKLTYELCKTVDKYEERQVLGEGHVVRNEKGEATLWLKLKDREIPLECNFTNIAPESFRQRLDCAVVEVQVDNGNSAAETPPVEDDAGADETPRKRMAP